MELLILYRKGCKEIALAATSMHVICVFIE